MGRSADVPRARSAEHGDDSGCSILHVDMDAFFASVEIRRRPELRNRPVIVGGGVRGVVAAASYAARRYGVRSAMPIGQALRLCPRAIVIPPDRAAYSAASAHVMAILRDVTPLVEPLSLDEAFLDISGIRRTVASPREAAEAIRARVSDEMGLTCSVGIATTKFVAKLASARCKPDGLLVVPGSAVLDFLHPLPVTVLWGVGARTAAPLHRLGVRSVADLAATPIDTLERAVGVSTAHHLHELSWGRDPRDVTEREPEKSISSDHTSDSDLTEAGQVHRELLRLAEDVAARVRARALVGRTVGIKIRFADFTTVTRVRTLPGWVDSTEAIRQAAVELYDALNLDRPRIRLVGVKCENLRDADSTPEQLCLDFTDPRPVRGATAEASWGHSITPVGTSPGPEAARQNTSTQNAVLPTSVTRTTVSTIACNDAVARNDAATRNDAAARNDAASRGSRRDSVVDAAPARFGDAALQRASLLRPAGVQGRKQTDSPKAPGSLDAHLPSTPRPHIDVERAE